MLVWSEVLPLSLVGESLFDGIDHFALTAVPLFILTGDVLVRNRIEQKIPRCRRGVDLLGKGRLRIRHRSSLWHVLGDFRVRRRRGCGGRTDDGSIAWLNPVIPAPTLAPLSLQERVPAILIPPSIAYIVIGLVLGISASTLFQAALIPGVLVLGAILLTNIVVQTEFTPMKAAIRAAPLRLRNGPPIIVRAIKNGWYAFPGSRHHLLRHFFRPLDANPKQVRLP